MQMHRHHLLEIILWPNGDGTFRKIINSKKRLRELEIYDDWKLTITIPADEHSSLHANNRSEEHCAKISAAQKGKKLTAEHCAKISAAQIGNTKAKGYKHSEEAKAKMSAAKKGKKPWIKGKKHSEETKAKISAAGKGNTNAKGCKGKKLSEETKAKISAARKGMKFTAEHCAKISATLKGKKYDQI
jgi:hypothetical protein